MEYVNIHYSFLKNKSKVNIRELGQKSKVNNQGHKQHVLLKACQKNSTG
jgi:hypothetical protein